MWIRCRGIAIRDETGKPIRMLGAHTDLTQLKHTEEELNQKNKDLTEANHKLEKALAEMKTLWRILPVCSYCKKIRDDDGYWEQLDIYIHKHFDANVSHGTCPDCLKSHHPKTYA